MPLAIPFLTLFLFVFASSDKATAQETGEPDSVETSESSQRMTKQVGDQQLTYLVQSPATDPPDTGWPLLLFLHGYGECGENVSKVKKHGPPLRILG